NLGSEFPVGDEKWGYNLLDERGVPGPAYEALRAMLKGWTLPSPAVLARRLQQALGNWVRGQRCEVLAEDVAVHLGDTELPPPWMPLHRGANPSAVWTGEFYLRRPGRGDWTLHINLMQPNERGSYLAVNGHRLEPDFPVEDYSRAWVSLSLTVPADYLRPGANRLTVVAGKELPDYQQLGYTWDDLQFKDIFLSER
ncbi:MAG: hypothetical protein ACETWB_04000, partial [Anaerolineae bacterium]